MKNKVMYKIIFAALLLFFTTDAKSAFSQDAGGTAAPAAPGGGALTAPQQFPEYIVTPAEDLNQFENTRVKKTKTDYRKGSSTIGTSLSKKSNAEINAEIEKRRAERQKAQEEAAATAAAAETPPAVPPVTTGDISAPGTSKLFKWKDKEGILHVTDDPTDIPPEYKDQVLGGM